MRRAALLLLLLLPCAAQAHGLDEYVQQALVSVARDRIDITLRLAPGVQVLPDLLAVIDSDRDGKISPAEARAYGRQVVGDLQLTLDGRTADLRLVSVQVPQPQQLRDGFGAIRLNLAATASSPPGSHRLEFSNGHLPKFSAWLVNSLVPRDKAVRLGAQQRNANQSLYRLDYTLAP